MIRRAITNRIKSRLAGGKVVMIYGPRQSGKSTLAETVLEETPHMYLNGDDYETRELLSRADLSKMKRVIGNHKMLFIDEAQRIPEIGLALKIVADRMKEVKIIVTGSSALDLSGKVNESLTGRRFDFMLFPLSFGEMAEHHGIVAEKASLLNRMIFGYYPEIVNHPGDEAERLSMLAESYLFKDLLMLEQIKKPVVLDKLVRALAHQIGSEVSYDELSQLTGSDRKTVEKYIDLLEKAFVVFRLPAFSGNIRNEIKKGRKIYFYDCGIRNALINDFRPFEIRKDKGLLFENLMMAERIKFLRNNGVRSSAHFWRTTQQQEIDLIEEYPGKLKIFEFKLRQQNVRFSRTFVSTYAPLSMQAVTLENCDHFLTVK